MFGPPPQKKGQQNSKKIVLPEFFFGQMFCLVPKLKGWGKKVFGQQNYLPN